jgi:DNA-binding NarL/FixJ family response regulator
MDCSAVLLASASPEVRKRWQDAFPSSQSIYEAENRDKLAYLLRQHSPAIAFVHLSLPGLHDGEGISLIHELSPATRLLVFSDRPNETEERHLLRVGMHGYLNTHASPHYIRKAVRVNCGGDMWVSRRLLAGMFEELRAPRNGAPNGALEAVLSRLTRREQDIVLLLANGNSNRAIAERLDISERTVKNHLSSIFEKTGTHDRVQLALLVCRNLKWAVA